MSEHLHLTKEEARRFLSLKHGLLGKVKFSGKEGVMEYIRQAGCIQFDPIDVCGKNSELVLQSRVKGFNKKMLDELLYEDRKLVDHFDKCLAIYPMETWPSFRRVREEFRERGLKRHETNDIAEEVREIIREKGNVSSGDIGFQDTLVGDWGRNTKLARAALEVLYSQGDVVIHHKKGARKYYALAKDYMKEECLVEDDPIRDDQEYRKWRVLRRIEAIGLLWDRASDALLMIRDLKAKERISVFHDLKQEGKIIPVTVEGIKEILYFSRGDIDLLLESKVKSNFKMRTEFIAPLDNLLWDRKLIKALFDFDYKWEIYTPVEERRFGYYVLPILQGSGFIGRIEISKDSKQKKLVLKNLWLEKGVRMTKKLRNELQRTLDRFMQFNDCEEWVDPHKLLE